MAEFDSVIPPGGSGKIIAKVHTQGQQGRRTKTIAVETDDPQRSHLTLRLSFEARPLIAVYPRPFVNLVTVQGGDAEAVLALRRGDGAPLEVEEVGATRPGIEVTKEKLAETVPPRNGLPQLEPGDWRIRVRLASTAEPRAETGRLRIVTDHPKKKELSIPLRVQVRRALEATPRTVMIEPAPGRALKSVSVVVRHNGHRRFRVKGAHLEGDLPGVTVRVPDSERAPVQRVELRVEPAGAPPGRHTGTLVIETNVKGIAPLRVPVLLAIAPDADDGEGSGGL